MPLNETHLTLLRAAAEREDLLLSRPDKMNVRSARSLATKLIRASCAAQVAVTADQPSWGEDESGPIGLRLTSAGLAEIGYQTAVPAASLPDGDTRSADPAEPRSGSKLARVLSLLQRQQGATLDELIGATGWLPHSTRAALTGLRKRGYLLTRTNNVEGQSTYRFGSAPTGAVAPDALAV